jgi:hypothetical protein
MTDKTDLQHPSYRSYPSYNKGVLNARVYHRPRRHPLRSLSRHR